jgi:hypothetical protein
MLGLGAMIGAGLTCAGFIARYIDGTYRSAWICPDEKEGFEVGSLMLRCSQRQRKAYLQWQEDDMAASCT